MPNCQDKAREALIQGIARTESLHVAQLCLENAVAKKDHYTITVASELIQDILNGKRGGNKERKLDSGRFVALDKHGNIIESRRDRIRKYTDYVQGKYDGVTFPFAKDMQRSRKSKRLRPVKCKPEDCPSCFWRRWCEMKSDYDFIDQATRTLDLSRKLVEGSEVVVHGTHRQTRNKWHEAKLVHKDAEPFDLREAQLTLAEAKELNEGTMTPEKKRAYDRAQGREPKKKSKGETLRAAADWHLTEAEKRRKRLMYGS